MEKRELIRKVKEITDLTSEEKSYLIELINNKKKYGLVWENKPEDVEEQLRSMLPILKEVKDKAILSEDKEAPNHILIEGDNLHALTALSYTHKGKIDVIYIDPPYNTGNKDFIYNDSYVDKEDSYRHSKWISFMEKRLRIAQELLSDTGVLFISIDDNEVAQLKLLCDDIFRSDNVLGILPTIMNLKGNQGEFAFAGTHEYTIAVCKKKTSFSPFELSLNSEELESWSIDDLGYFKKGAILKSSGAENRRIDRPYMFYPILINSTDNVSTISEEEYLQIYNSSKKEFNDDFLLELCSRYQKLGYEVILPKIGTNEYGRWRWGYSRDNIRRLSYDVIVQRTNNGITLYKKQRPDLGDIPSSKPKSILYKPEYSSGNGTMQVVNIFGSKIFDNPKPIELLRDLFFIGSNKNCLILDFFAGSGTTLHATMDLNKEDGGKRQCILVTNNENNIAEEVTYKRNRKVIQGYTNAKGEKIEGLSKNNLRYYKSDFVPSEQTEQNRRRLTKHSTELICIKEDCYTEITEQYQSEFIQTPLVRIFTNNLGKHLILIYHSHFQHEVIQELIELIPKLKSKEKVKIYSFSPEKETIEEEFRAISNKIDAIPLPDSIYNAYKQCFRTIQLNKNHTIVSLQSTEN